MKVLDRLKMELSNQQYFSDEQYNQFLTENNLTPTDEYYKGIMQKNLYFTCIDVLEAVTNDIDLMTGISTEFADIGQAYEFLEARIINLKDKIASIPDDDEEEVSAFTLMFTRGKKTTKTVSSGSGSNSGSGSTGTTENMESISNEELEEMIRKEFDI